MRLRFALVFVVLLAAGFYAAETLFARRALLGLCGVTAAASGSVLRWIGMRVGVAGSTIRLARGGTLLIIDECTGIYAMIVYASILCAFPSPIHLRAAGIAGGIAMLAVLNLVRIVAAGIILDRAPGLFHPLHDYLWQIGYMGATFVLALLWMRWAARGPRPIDPGRAVGRVKARA